MCTQTYFDRFALCPVVNSEGFLEANGGIWVLRVGEPTSASSWTALSPHSQCGFDAQHATHFGVDMWTCGRPKSSTELVPRQGEPPGGVRVVVVQAIRPARSAGAPCGTRTNICLRLKSKANRPDLPSISKRRQINNKRNISF